VRLCRDVVKGGPSHHLLTVLTSTMARSLFRRRVMWREFVLLDWPFDASSTLAVQGWSFWFSVIGIITTVIGFYLTLVQLVRTKSATLRVKEELQNIQFVVSRFSGVEETSRAEAALAAARKHVRNAEWVQASEALEVFSKSIHILHELKIDDIASHDEALSKAALHARKLCERLEGPSPGLSDAEAPKTLTALRDHDRLLTSIRVALDRSNFK